MLSPLSDRRKEMGCPSIRSGTVTSGVRAHLTAEDGLARLQLSDDERRSAIREEIRQEDLPRSRGAQQEIMMGELSTHQ
jgi:hypothetical protein